MKTIFLYSVDNNKGGIENYTLNLVKAIQNETNEYKFHILTEYNDFAFKEQFLNTLKCEYSILPNHRKKPRLFYKKLLNLLLTNNNAILQINAMSYCNLQLFKAARASKIKTIIVSHASGTQNIFKKIVHITNRLLFKNFGEKIAISKNAALFMFGKRATPKIVLNGIYKENFLFNDTDRIFLREKYSLDKSDIVIGQVGRISPLKNQSFTISLFERLPNNYHLFLIGKSQNEKILRKVLKIKNNRIHLIAETNEINKYYSLIDIFLMPSKSEGAGLALYEAAVSGCDCIASNKVPFLDETNIIFLNLNKSSWIKNLENISLRKRTNFDKTKNIPTIEEQARNYLAIYNNC